MQKSTEKSAKIVFLPQQDQSDCGVACLKMLLQYYGSDASLEKLRELSGTNKQGTTLLGLYQAANQIGFKAEGNQADITALIEHGKPLILHVLLDEKLEHFVVCYGYSKDKGFLIADPAKNVSYWQKDKVEKVWQSKVCLTLEPTEELQSKKVGKKQKLQWIINLVKEDKKLLLFSLFLGIMVAVLNMATAVYSQKLIDDILPNKNMQKLVGGTILFGILLLTRVVFDSMRGYLLATQSKRFNYRIADYFYSHLLWLPKAFFDTRKIGELTARLNDTNRIQRVIQIVANNFMIDLIMMLVCFTFLFYYHWQIGVIALVAMPVYFILIYRFNKRIIASQKEVMQSYAMSEAHYVSSMQGIASIKNHNKLSFFQKLNQQIFGNYQERIFSLRKININISVQSGVVGVLFLIAILATSSYMVLEGKMLLGEMMAVLSIAGMLLPSITNLALISIPINEANVAFDRMFEYTSIQPEESGKIEVSEIKSIQVENLSFRFPGRSQLFQDVSFQLSIGETFFLLGENGSGKSTLGQILQKLYQWESGDVIVNQKYSLKDIKLENWRNLIGVIPQEISLFNGSLLDNILLGEPMNQEKLHKFIIEYGFEPFLQSLPQGLATIVGEEGVNLSGGQKQMLALMRALYKAPQFLILDEPSSAMSKKNKAFFFDLLQKLKLTTAILIISHQENENKQFADKVFVLE